MPKEVKPKGERKKRAKKGIHPLRLPLRVKDKQRANLVPQTQMHLNVVSLPTCSSPR